jgi:hypothetical protein
MTGGANSKFLTRFMAVAFVALAFAGCAAMFAQGGRSLFADAPMSEMASQGD